MTLGKYKRFMDNGVNEQGNNRNPKVGDKLENSVFQTLHF